MKNISKKLSILIIRVGEYISRFGFYGVVLSFEHFFKYRLGWFKSITRTNIPGIGYIYMRPRSSDLATFREIVVNGDYDFKEKQVLQLLNNRYNQILEGGRVPLIIDAGANIGLASLQFKLQFPACEVFAVEPAKDSIELAAMNLQSVSNIILHQLAIWDKQTSVELVESKDQSSRSIKSETSNGSATIMGETMDGLVGRRAQDLLLVKIDIEGSESRIFTQNDVVEGWLNAHPLVIIEGHDGTHNSLGSLAGLLQHSVYRTGSIRSAGPALLVVPTTWYEDIYVNQ